NRSSACGRVAGRVASAAISRSTRAARHTTRHSSGTGMSSQPAGRPHERDLRSCSLSACRAMPLEPRSAWDLMQKHGQAADVAYAKRRFQALRRAIAVHLLDAGADVAFVQDRLGHANIQNTMVYRRYTTVTRDAQTRHMMLSPVSAPRSLSENDRPGD